MGNGQKNTTTKAAALGAMIVLLILILGTLWMGRAARKDTEESVRLVSLLYLDELAGRREQVVQNNLEEKIRDLQVAVGLMDAMDLDDMEHLQAYQSRMRKLYNLEKFAFVDTEGRIYTADGMQDNIDEYAFDYKTISEPEVSIFNLESTEKKVIIAVPVDLDFMEEKFLSLISENYRQVYEWSTKDKSDWEKVYNRILLATDTISGMTDSYARDLYTDLNGITR